MKKLTKLPREEAVGGDLPGDDDVEGHLQPSPDSFMPRLPGTGGELAPGMPGTGGDARPDDDGVEHEPA
jgi:hypothetical protein